MAEQEKDLKYMSGFASTFETEALPNALPKGQNSPQICAYGLYAEQLSGTAFTVPRVNNQRSWLYRIRPSVKHHPYQPNADQTLYKEWNGLEIEPNQLRWNAMELTKAGEVSLDFVDGLRVICGAGDPAMKSGLCIYNYLFTTGMTVANKGFHSSDGDFLIVPQEGTLLITTELGKLKVEPCMIAVIPRGIKFSVDRAELPVGEPAGFARGYCIEIFQGHYELPNLGPIGSNGLANPRDFETPVASYEDREVAASGAGTFKLVNKFLGKLYTAEMEHSPYDVVAWHGNYYPYRYDLRRFNCINSVTFDHPDPSIYTVLTVPSGEPGVAVLDFVIFPPRWMVMENTFRPPWYHRNCMSEYMGLIYGKYDAKSGSGSSSTAGGEPRKKSGFNPGGGSLHSCMTPHGPDAGTFVGASAAPLSPKYFDQGLAFMFESKYLFKVAPGALVKDTEEGAVVAAASSAQGAAAVVGPTVQTEYFKCWEALPKLFTGEPRPPYPWDGAK